VEFVRGATWSIGLDRIEVVHSRAEEAAADPLHCRAYDLVVARAVAPLERLAGWMSPLLADSGMAVAMKSRHSRPEVEGAQRAIRSAGLVVDRIVQVDVPVLGVARDLVVLRKAAPASPTRVARA
jgi:16S rRNA (guanine527-N7)-methyltransferase